MNNDEKKLELLNRFYKNDISSNKNLFFLKFFLKIEKPINLDFFNIMDEFENGMDYFTFINKDNKTIAFSLYEYNQSHALSGYVLKYENLLFEKNDYEEFIEYLEDNLSSKDLITFNSIIKEYPYEKLEDFYKNMLDYFREVFVEYSSRHGLYTNIEI